MMPEDLEFCDGEKFKIWRRHQSIQVIFLIGA